MMPSFKWGVSAAALLCASAGWAQEVDTSAAQMSGGTASAGGDIIVTASRREESLAKVPLAVAAFSQEQLTDQNLRTIDDLTRVTPGVSFSRSAYGTNRADAPAIRGIGSNIGGGTTGIYVDDTPITSRFSANISSPAFPRLFDLERVEVLKGPQGTLFGAGAMGGAIRFITPTPSLTKSRILAQAELATSAFDQNYEAGVAVGTPIVEDKLGINISGYFRRDGGFVDRRAVFGNNVDENANWQRAAVVSGSLLWKPADNVSIIASVLYQNEYANDTSQVYEQFTNRSKRHYENRAAVRSPSKDEFALPSLRTEFDFGPVVLNTNTSYLSRRATATVDYTQEVNAILSGLPDPADRLVPQFALQLYPGEEIPALYDNRQKVFTQEIRLSSSNDGSAFKWVVGAFYSKLRQRDRQLVFGAQDLDQISNVIFGAPTEAVFGLGPVDDFGYQGLTYVVANDPTQIEKAVFGQAEYEIVDGFKIIAGLRYSESRNKFHSVTDGPVNGARTVDNGSDKEHALTPKFGIAWQVDQDNLFYANVAKGFRPGGAQPPVPFSFCGEDLTRLGLTSSPNSYDADSLWNYEVGSKNALFDRRLRIDASAYYIKWSNIQRSVYLPACTLNYVANLGTVETKGFELALSARPVDALSLGLNVGYTDARSKSTIPISTDENGNLIYLTRKGEKLDIRPWTVGANARYDFEAFGNESYARVDYEFQSGTYRSGGPEIQGYDPITSARVKATHVVKIQAGTTFGPVELTGFVDNLFDANTVLSQTRYATGSDLTVQTILRPRTFGMRVAYRY